MSNINEGVPKLLRAIANTKTSKNDGHHIILDAAADELDRSRQDINRLRGYLQTFCDRVDNGEVKSVKTYAMFKKELATADAQNDIYRNTK